MGIATINIFLQIGGGWWLGLNSALVLIEVEGETEFGKSMYDKVSTIAGSVNILLFVPKCVKCVSISKACEAKRLIILSPG